MFKLKHSLGLFLAALSLNAFATTHSTNLLMAGCVFFNVDGEQPCLYKSAETMTEWQYNDNFTNLPSDRKFVINKSVTCSDNTCLSVGGFNTYSAPDSYTPFVFKSDDNGLNWAMKSITLPNSSNAGLGFINCNNGECIAIGSYISLKNKTKPLILISHDNFNTWQQITNISNLEPDASIGFRQYACTSEYCVITTSLYNAKHDASHPFFLFSSNDRAQWSAIPIPSDTPFYRHMKMTGMSCSKNTCTAVGYAVETDGPFDPTKPLLYVSHDKGRKWQSKAISDDISLNTVKCQDNYCIAIGAQNKNNVVLVTQDEWNTWTVKTLEKPINSTAFLTDVDCTNNFCVIGASDEDQNGQSKQFLMYVTHDKGNTWRLIKNISNLPVLKSIAITGLSCNTNNCLVSLEDGYFFNTLLPIVVTSDNTGENWRAAANPKNVPNGINAMLVDNVYHDQSTSAARYSPYHSYFANAKRSDRMQSF